MRLFDPGVSLAELRLRVRGEEGGGDKPPPPRRQAERAGDVRRVGYGEREKGHERHE